MKRNAEILIVGMGPVGLLAALLLARQGIDVVIIDKRAEYFNESRSIGIHPPLLDHFESIGILQEMLANGNIIEETNVYLNNKLLFKTELNILRNKNKFVLTLPQNQTEKILLKSIKDYGTVEIERGKTLISLEQKKNSVISSFSDGTTINSKFILGCDGRNSTVRDLINLPFNEKPYRDFYCMADFNDADTPPQIANIYLNNEGLVESIPLPGGLRRWVLRTGSVGDRTTNPVEFARLIAQRTPRLFPLGEQATDLRFFNASKFISKKFYENRVFLLGDAAHIVSPIGGQGMNLGWIAAINLSKKIKPCLLSDYPFAEIFKNLDTEHRIITKLTIKRSEKNMSFGRPSPTLILRSYLLKALSQSFYKKTLIQEFTMGGVINKRHQ